MINRIINVITGSITDIDVPDTNAPIIIFSPPPPTIDDRMSTVETDVDDIVTVLASMEGVSL